MVSTNLTFQPLYEGKLPLSLWVTILAIFSAVGIVLRQLTIPTFSPFVTITPGFAMPLLVGLVLGPLGGILCGAFVGISGAFWEPILIPLVGNVALGLSTGIPTYYRQKLNNVSWIILCIFSAIVIGGFLPTFSIEILILGIPLYIAALTAIIDAVQAGIWVIVALFLTQGLIEPILFRYRRMNRKLERIIMAAFRCNIISFVSFKKREWRKNSISC